METKKNKNNTENKDIKDIKDITPTYTDMHSHILPGLDDGARDMQETLAALREARAQGFNRIIVTPHFHPERYVVYGIRIMETLDKVRAACRKEGISIQLLPGQECYYYSGLVEELERGRALTMCGTRYVLVEFDPMVPWSAIRLGVRDLVENGYRPILAHFERYECLSHIERLKELRSQGVLLQMNYDTLRKTSILHRSPWRGLVQKGYVDLLGSDCHGTHFRPFRVQPVNEWLDKSVDERIADRMRRQNIALLLENLKKNRK